LNSSFSFLRVSSSSSNAFRVEIQKEQIVKKDGSIKGLYEIVKENKTQLEIKDKEIALLKTEKSTKYWKGLFTGLGTGAGIVLALVIL